MIDYFRKTIKKLLPPILVDLYRVCNRNAISFRGEFRNWQEAKAHSCGYDSERVVQRVYEATRLVREGKAACERDGMIFETVQYPFSVLAVLLRATSENGGRLNVLDFGGALGSTYFQCRGFLKNVRSINWNVVEQPLLVEYGRNRGIEDEELRFFANIEAVLAQSVPQVALFSGVLQYLETPIVPLCRVIDAGIPFIVIDRTPFTLSGRQILSVQQVPPALGGASYPVWLFKRETLTAPFERRYRLITEIEALDGILGNGKQRAEFRTLIYQKINS